jgi:tight adherence protein B
MGTFVVVLIAIWAVVVGTWFVISKAFRSSDIDKIKSRLTGNASGAKKKSAAPGSRSLFTQDARAGGIAEILKKYNLLPVIHRLLEQAGLKWDPVKLIHSCLFAFVVCFGLVWSSVPGNFRYVALLAGFFGAALPILYVLRLRKLRLRRFEELFPESLEFVARSMRAGHAFSVSLEMIHKEFQEPLASEFRRTFEEHNLGLPLDVALQKLAKRVPSLDVHFFVSAVLLQKRTGGNLSEILDKLAVIIRERFKLRGRIRAISAHGKMTGTALTLIPVGVAVLMFYVNPDYIKFFFLDETGNMMMGAAVVLQLIGYGIIRQIVKIEI